MKVASPPGMVEADPAPGPSSGTPQDDIVGWSARRVAMRKSRTALVMLASGSPRPWRRSISEAAARGAGSL